MIKAFLPKDWNLSPQNQKSFMHSKTVANAALLIAKNTSELDSNKAYSYGLMHDIGKFYLPKSEMYKHPRIGYDLMKNSHPDIANICISHPFPNFESYDHIMHYCQNDRTEASQISDILKTVKKNDYIELVQFCDKVSRLDDYISLEEKLKWYLATYNINQNELSGHYLNQLNHIKSKFDSMTSSEVYKILSIAN